MPEKLDFDIITHAARAMSHELAGACLPYVELGSPDTGQVSELTRFEALTDEEWAPVEPFLP